MTTQIEIIDGLRYRVTRDEKGSIVQQAGAEIIPSLPADPVRAAARLLLAKDPDTWTLADVSRALRFIIRRLLD